MYPLLRFAIFKRWDDQCPIQGIDTGAYPDKKNTVTLTWEPSPCPRIGKNPVLSSWKNRKLCHHFLPRWWVQIFFIFTPIWGRFPIWLIFFKGVETTNQLHMDQIFFFRKKTQPGKAIPPYFDRQKKQQETHLLSLGLMSSLSSGQFFVGNLCRAHRQVNWRRLLIAAIFQRSTSFIRSRVPRYIYIIQKTLLNPIVARDKLRWLEFYLFNS